MRDWQPIETAPKDGTWVLGYFPSMKVHAVPCHYGIDVRIGHDGESFWGMFGIGALYGDKCMIWPTHWQPLPLPPETAS